MRNSKIGDIRLKTNLAPIQNALSGLESVHGYEHRLDTEKIHDYNDYYGLVSQELETEFPHLIKENFNIKNDTIQYKTIDHNQLIAVMVEAINQLNNKIIDIQKEIKKDKKRSRKF